MSHPLTLEVPDDIYESLVHFAQYKGSSPEKLAVEWLGAIHYDAVRDPLEKFIGAFPSNDPNWADQHDKYLGEALAEEMRHPKKNED